MCSQRLRSRGMSWEHVVGHRDPRQLHDAGLDGVHQGEVADRPGEERPFGVARTAQEERGRREVEDDGDGDGLLHRLDAGDPNTGRLGVLLRFLGIVALEVRFLAHPGLLAVAVVSLVVERQDALQAHQRRHHPAQHLALRLHGAGRLPAAPQ